MRERTVEMAGAMAKAGVGLLALPLVELPAVTWVQIRTDGAQAHVSIQLSAVEGGDQVAGLLAWADVLPESAAIGLEGDDYIRMAVSGVIDGVRVEVWTHIRGERLVDIGCFLDLLLEREPYALPLSALRALAEHRAVISRVPERAVLVCQFCHDVWEPAATGAQETAALVTAGCPECGGWVWLGELVEVAVR